MSGWEICKRLKSDTADGRLFASTGVIMLTGIGENLNDLTSPLFAADAWLNKPFDFLELDERVRDTLARYSKAARRRRAASALATGTNRKTPAKKNAAKPAAEKRPAKKTVAKGTVAKKAAAKPGAVPAKKSAAKKRGANANAKASASKVRTKRSGAGATLRAR
jgi:DNA-binding response OmpR family regulator